MTSDTPASLENRLFIKFSIPAYEEKWQNSLVQSNYMSKYVGFILALFIVFTAIEIFGFDQVIQHDACIMHRLFIIGLLFGLQVGALLLQGRYNMVSYLNGGLLFTLLLASTTLNSYCPTCKSAEWKVGILYYMSKIWGEETHWINAFSNLFVMNNLLIYPFLRFFVVFPILLSLHFYLDMASSFSFICVTIFMSIVAYVYQFYERRSYSRSLNSQFDDNEAYFSVSTKSIWAIRRYFPLKPEHADQDMSIESVPGFPREDVVVTYGKGWRDLTGYTSEEIRSLKNRFVAKDDSKALKEVGRFILAWVRKTWKSQEEYEKRQEISCLQEEVVQYRIIMKDGTQKWVSAALRPYFDKNGVFQYVVEIISDQHKYHQKRMLQEIAGATADARRRTFAMVSHELQTPLNGVVGSSQLIRNTDLNNEQREILSMLEDSLTNLNLFVSNSLLLSQLDSGLPLQIQPVYTPMKSVLEEMISLVTPTAASLGIEFIFECLTANDTRVGACGVACVSKCCKDDSNMFVDHLKNGFVGSDCVRGKRIDVPSEVVVDKKRLHQVLLNLVNYVIRNSHRGGEIIMTLEAFHKQNNDGSEICLSFSVCRQGRGMFVDRNERTNSMILDSFYAQGTDTVPGLRTPSFDYGTFRHLTQQPFMPHSMIDLRACKLLIHNMGGVLWDSTDYEHYVTNASSSSSEDSPEPGKFRDTTSFHFFVPVKAKQQPSEREPCTTTNKVTTELPKTVTDFDRAVSLLSGFDTCERKNILEMEKKVPGSPIHILLIEASEQARLVHERMFFYVGFTVHTAANTTDVETVLLDIMKTRKGTSDVNPFAFIVSEVYIHDGVDIDSDVYGTTPIVSPRFERRSLNFGGPSFTTTSTPTLMNCGSGKQLCELFLASLWSKNQVRACPLVILTTKKDNRKETVGFIPDTFGLSGGPTVNLLKPMMVWSLSSAVKQMQEKMIEQDSAIENVDTILRSVSEQAPKPLEYPSSRASSSSASSGTRTYFSRSHFRDGMSSVGRSLSPIMDLDESEEAAFSLTLPEKIIPSISGMRKEKKKENNDSIFQGKRILVVDDVPVNQKIAHMLLTRLGCEVTTANDGREAVDCVRESEEGYDAILMDLQMPILDGVGATKEIRKWEEDNMKKSTPILAVTAQGQSEYIPVCLKAGMDKYLTKPIHAPSCKEALREVWSIYK